MIRTPPFKETSLQKCCSAIFFLLKNKMALIKVYLVNLMAPDKGLVVVTTLFVMWAVALNLNDILIPHLKKACGLTDLQSALIQTTYFGVYFLAALPAGWLMRRVGYKNGILAGLALCIAGALLFYPASYSRVFSSFLAALFVMASGAAVLEVGANPFVVQLGAPESAEWRLNMVQTFNALGAAAAPQIGKLFILSGIEHTPEEIAAMPTLELDEYRAMEAGLVRTPYIFIACAFALIAWLVWVNLPEVAQEEENQTCSFQEGLKRVLRNRFVVTGITAQFLYVGAQVGASSFLIRFVQGADPQATERGAADVLFVHLVLFLAGRMAGTYVMARVSPTALLAGFAGTATLCTVGCVSASGSTAIFSVVLLGLCNSIMFPTIFSLTVRGLGDLTKPASALLVMSIVGGAVLPAVMGYVSDSGGIQAAFAPLGVCYLGVVYFALQAHRQHA